MQELKVTSKFECQDTLAGINRTMQELKDGSTSGVLELLWRINRTMQELKVANLPLDVIQIAAY